MRLCPIIFLVLLAACGREVRQAPIPADLLVPCEGWTGPTPRTEGQLVDAAFAEMRGRKECNLKIEAIAALQ